jgi:hypothetical protein
MEQTPIRAVEMVRSIRDAIYEETKHLSREELIAYFAREAAAMRQEGQRSARDVGGGAQPALAPDVRAQR